MLAVRDACPKTFYIINSPVRNFFLPTSASAVCKYSSAPNTLNGICKVHNFSRPYLHFREAKQQIIPLKSTNVTIKAHTHISTHNNLFSVQHVSAVDRPSPMWSCRDLCGNYKRFYVIIIIFI
jgi:hypothetical protein